MAITFRYLHVNDLNVYILEAKPASDGPNPLLILLHGFPEMAYSWRKVMEPLCAAGFHVVAPDQRGYGHTNYHHRIAFTDDVAPFRMLNLAADIVSLVYALGYTSVACIVGHDFGSAVAGHCALMRPDVFKSVVLMSAPYTGASVAPSPIAQLNNALATLTPPRKHYTAYYSTPEANDDMCSPPQGLRAFLRAYYHVKSGDWPHNAPHRLPELSAVSLARLPLYYVMNLHETMPQTVAHDAPSAADTPWLTDAELDTYVSVYEHTGFQGGLNRYRCMMDARWSEDLAVFANKRIEVPAMFISGKKDWGVFQLPGALEKMRSDTCVSMREEDYVLVDSAGHWVQQEKPEMVVECLLSFLKRQEA